MIACATYKLDEIMLLFTVYISKCYYLKTSCDYSNRSEAQILHAPKPGSGYQEFQNFFSFYCSLKFPLSKLSTYKSVWPLLSFSLCLVHLFAVVSRQRE